MKLGLGIGAMGMMRAAAARLGLRLSAAAASANNKISISNRCITSSAATDVGKKMNNKGMKLGCGTELNKEKCLYLTFYESSECAYVNHRNLVLRRITLNKYDDHKVEELRGAVYNNKYSDNTIINRCVRLGSKIMFSVGYLDPENICYIDTSSPTLKFQVPSAETEIKNFSTIKCGNDMKWSEIDGKLYCISQFDPDWFRPNANNFEVLDPRDENASWQPLMRPPFIQDTSCCTYRVLFLKGSKKILGWEYKEPKAGVFCFDTTKPDEGWIKSMHPSVKDNIPLLDYAKSLVVHTYHPRRGAFNIMFTYNPLKEPCLVSAFFISDKCDSFHSSKTGIKLPESCYEYFPDRDVKLWSNVCFSFEFVNLGDQKMGIVLHKFFTEDPDDIDKNKGIVLFLTFEYNIIVSSDNSLEMHIGLLGTRRFRYYPRKRPVKDNTNIGVSFVTGAFFF